MNWLKSSAWLLTSTFALARLFVWLLLTNCSLTTSTAGDSRTNGLLWFTSYFKTWSLIQICFPILFMFTVYVTACTLCFPTVHTDDTDSTLSDSGCILPLNRTSNISYFFFIHLSHLSHHFHTFPLSPALTPYIHIQSHTFSVLLPWSLSISIRPSSSLSPTSSIRPLSSDAGHTGSEAAGGMVVDNYLVFGAPQESGPSRGVVRGGSDKLGCIYNALQHLASGNAGPNKWAFVATWEGNVRRCTFHPPFYPSSLIPPILNRALPFFLLLLPPFTCKFSLRQLYTRQFYTRKHSVETVMTGIKFVCLSECDWGFALCVPWEIWSIAVKKGRWGDEQIFI